MIISRDKAGRRIRFITAGVLVIMVCLAAAFGVYVNMDYPAQLELSSFMDESGITYHKEQKAYQVFPDTDMAIPAAASAAGDSVQALVENTSVGIIFYPGAKVQEAAYLPLLQTLAENGVYCLCVHMPFQLAVFDVNAAHDLMNQFPEIDRWYLMGHSLGGAMAASYAQKHSLELDGLILLGAYAAKDLSQTQLRVLSIFGSEDQVLNREKYEQCRKNLPASYQEVIIEGGNHAQFGCYGEQKGDGAAQISPQEQRTQTAQAVVRFLTED